MERYGIAEWMDGQLEELRGIKIENGIMSAQRCGTEQRIAETHGNTCGNDTKTQPA